MVSIKLIKEEMEKAKVFAEQSLKTHSYYKDRNQKDQTIIQNQIFIGKKGEIGVWKWLKSKSIQCSDIDFTVTKKKSFKPDIIVEGNIPCHIKSQSIETAKIFSESWTFQYSGKGRGHTDNSIFTNYGKNDFVVFCIVDNDNVRICAKIPVSEIHKLDLFKDPDKVILKGIKKVVSLKDIPTKYLVNEE